MQGETIMPKMTNRSFSFNTQYLLPTQGYHNQLMREIDDAAWEGDDEELSRLELTASDVQRYLDKGDTWYPNF